MMVVQIARQDDFSVPSLYLSHVRKCCSPLQVPISEASDPSKVKVHGPGVSPAGVKMNSKTYFIVDCTQAGPGTIPLSLDIKIV